MARLLSRSTAAWLALTTRTTEMLFASGRVVGHRTGRMMLAGPLPSQADRREFHLMVREKREATLGSSHAMMSQLMATNAQLWRQMLTAQLGAATALASFVASRTTGQALARHANLVRAVTPSPVAARRLSHSTARLAHSGLGPIRSRAIANAKRLRKR